MTTVVLGLGTNLGDRRANLEAALRLLQEHAVTVVRASSVWQTPPMPEGQPDYFNAVAVGETAISARQLLAAAKDVERQLGRRPNRRWGPRPIDVDILFFGDEKVSDLDLEVPHPGISERAFVLAPLAEVLRGPLPVIGESAAELIARVERTGLRRVCALALP